MSDPFSHPSMPTTGVRLYGKRVVLRPLGPPDFHMWSEVRCHNEAWLTPWEPLRATNSPDPALHRDVFNARCSQRDKERQLGQSYAFGLFVNGDVCGEANINNVVRGVQQSATIGYWIDQRRAGNAYTSEAVVVLLRFAFEQLRLHRIEICIIPRNGRSRRVIEKLGLRSEGLAERYLLINGVWEDHLRFAITEEEWLERSVEFAEWLGDL